MLRKWCFWLFHYKIIRLTRINHSWLVRITSSSNVLEIVKRRQFEFWCHKCWEKLFFSFGIHPIKMSMWLTHRHITITKSKETQQIFKNLYRPIIQYYRNYKNNSIGSPFHSQAKNGLCVSNGWFCSEKLKKTPFSRHSWRHKSRSHFTIFKITLLGSSLKFL